MNDLTENNIKKEDISFFKQKYIGKSFAVGLFLSSIDCETVNVLKKIKNIKLFSLNEQQHNNVINLRVFLNNDYEFNIVLNLMSAIVSDNDDIINLAENLHVKTLNFKKQNIVKIKKDLENYRIELKERELLKKLKQPNLINGIGGLHRQCNLLYSLYNLTFNKKYLLDEISAKNIILEIEPKNYDIMGDLAILYYLVGDIKSSKIYWEKSADKITNKNLLFSYGCYSCFFKNFEDFFKYYPLRFEKNIAKALYPKTDKPKWCGEKNVSDKTLLVFFEQGYGDTFLFVRYISYVEKLFKKVFIVVQTACKKLIQDSFPKSDVLTLEEFEVYKKRLPIDYHIPMMDLQIALNIYPTDYHEEKWLVADKTKTEKFSQYINSEKFNIGIFWDSQVGENKRFIDLETLIPLAYIKNVQLYSLHIDKEDIEVNYVDENVNIINLGKHFKNFADTAATIENMDLIISTDSSVLNLAGALGKKTFGIFNTPHEWRWYQLEGEDVGWYKSVKPFKAKNTDEFEPLINAIKTEIKISVSKK